MSRRAKSSHRTLLQADDASASLFDKGANGARDERIDEHEVSLVQRYLDCDLVVEISAREGAFS